MTTPDPNPQPRLIPVEEFFADPAFVVPTISPDGTRIAYLAPHRGRRNVWVRGVDQTHDDAVPCLLVGSFSGGDDLRLVRIDRETGQEAVDADVPGRSLDNVGIRTPRLVAPGANDVRVPEAQSDRIVASLRQRGVPVEYLLAEDEGHGFENEENRLRLYRAVECQLARHPGGRHGATSDVDAA